MQAGRAGGEQFAAQLRRRRDPRGAHRLGTARLGRYDQPIGERGRELRTRHRGHALDLGEVRHGHDPGDHRLRAAEGAQFVDEVDVVLHLEEQLRDGVVGDGELVGQTAAVVGPVARLRMHLGVGGDPHGEPASDDVVHEIDGVVVVARRGVDRVDGRIAAQGQDVLDAGGLVAVEDLGDLGAGVAEAGEVGHRRDARLATHPVDDAVGAGPRRPTGAVRDGHEARLQRFQFGDGPSERHLRVIGAGREELERERASGSEQIGDAGHWVTSANFGRGTVEDTMWAVWAVGGQVPANS